MAKHYSDESYDLRIDLDTENCDLSEGEINQLEQKLNPLREPLRKFPVAVLYINIRFHSHSHTYRVKLALQLPGRTLATGDLDEAISPAMERSVRKLLQALIAYEQSMSRSEERSKTAKGTRGQVTPTSTPDAEAIAESAAEGDYAIFRRLTFDYEEPLRKRIGRWVQRYPEVQEQIGEELTLADLVEEVFLTAFERYEDRPANVPLGDWLESLVDPSLKLLYHHRDEELENISFARTLHEAE